MTAKIKKKKSGKMKNFLKKGEFKDEASEVQFIVVFFLNIFISLFLSVTESAEFVVTKYGHHLQTC